MKNKLQLFGLAGLVFAFFSFSIVEKNVEEKDPKHARHIKMTKIENGKKFELDTVLYNDKPFLWNGDTINPAKLDHAKKVSGNQQMQQFDITVDNEGGEENIMIYKFHGDNSGEPMIWNSETGEEMEIVTEHIDSTGKKIVIKKMSNGSPNHMIFRTCPPNMPYGHPGKVIDLNDPDVISYEKKDIRGGKEKIVIIRKKSEGPEEMNFSFETGDEMMMPPPPPPPAAPVAPGSQKIKKEYNTGNENIKIIEESSKVDGKDQKQIQVEVESKETK